MSTVLPAESATPARTPPGPFPVVTAALIAATLGGFAIELVRGFLFDGNNAELFVSLGGNVPYKTLGGQAWRLLTSQFLSPGPLGLAMTVICLAQLRQAERVFGRLGHLAIWLAGGLVSAIGYCAYAPTNVVSVGGAGGVFAMYGAYLAFLYVQRKRFDKVTMSSNLRSIGLFLAINIVYALGAPNANPIPLLSGLVSGAAIGAWLVFGSPNRKTLMVRAALGVVVTLAVTAGTLCAMPARAPVQTSHHS